jgi:glycosyltransferase involved in cell wall biosynthesis
MNLIHVPIELLEERYSKQWFHWFDAEFKKFAIDVLHVLPLCGIDAKIQTGEFLDVIGTLEFKSEQLRWICSLFREQQIKKDTVFLIADAWFPGLEMLAYLRDALHIPFKIVGIFHAGTWDQYDFITKAGMRSWGQPCELAWCKILDAICVGTQFHKDLIIKSIERWANKDILKNKIRVTGLPIYPDFVKPVKKENIIVFPHRLAQEKNPEYFDELCKGRATDFYDWTFIKTKEVAHTKSEYYALLNRSKVAVSFADQETFGISMLESVLCGCIPIVPNKLSYKELYPAEFKYPIGIEEDSKIEYLVYNASILLRQVLTNYEMYQEKLQFFMREVQWKGEQAIFNILKICVEICVEICNE